MFSTIALLVLIPLASGCYYDSSACTDFALRYNLPCSIRSAPITVYTVADAAPFVSQVGNGPPYGLDIDLLNYISYVYRINFQYVFVQFADLLAAVQNDVNAISMSTQTITPERIDLVYFAQFFETGTGFLVRSDYGETIENLASLCGKSVGVITGTTQEADVTEQNSNCAAGSSITIVSLATFTELLERVTAGTVNVVVSDEATVTYAASESGGVLTTTGTPYNVQPYGIGCNRDNRELCCALVNAINSFIRDGLYSNLLEKYSYSFQNNGICPSRINLLGSRCEPRCRIRSGTCAALAGG